MNKGYWAQIIRLFCPSNKGGDKLEKLVTKSCCCSWYTSAFRVTREEPILNLGLMNGLLFEFKHERHVGIIVVLTGKIALLLPPIISS